MSGFDATSFTRCDLKTGSFSLLDGFLISNNLRSRINNVRISHDGSNVSDHSPVEFDLEIPISLITQAPSRLPRYVNWKKLTTEQKSAFHHEMSQRLNSIEVSYASTCHGSSCCTNDSHKVCLENYYCDIVNAVLAAEAVLPKTNPNIFLDLFGRKK